MPDECSLHPPYLKDQTTQPTAQCISAQREDRVETAAMEKTYNKEKYVPSSGPLCLKLTLF